MKYQVIESFILQNNNDYSFDDIALELFRYHYFENPVYAQFCKALHVDIESVTTIEKIPFLPISFFKNHIVVPQNLNTALIFESSGTSGTDTSTHHVAYPELYELSFKQNFHHVFGDLKDFSIYALLPSYLERTNSSLVYMAEKLINQTTDNHNNFFLYDFERLQQKLKENKQRRKKTILLGVSFALLDFADAYGFHFPELTIVETGGMKGRREEITRQELHSKLISAFGISRIHSEYGMTELLSQAWSTGDGRFVCPHWMRVLIRDINDPFSFVESGKSGGINVIDLANAFSCPFIATDDLGKLYADSSFEVLGRADYSAIRGCNTMIDN